MTKIWNNQYQKKQSNPSFFIYNKSIDSAIIGISSKGWFFTPKYYYGYICSYFFKKYGKTDFIKHLRTISKENIDFISSDGETICVNEIELVSEYLLNFLLQDFFEQEKISQELLNKACLQEMTDKGYINILEEK